MGNVAEMGRLLRMVQDSFKADLDVILMRDEYFRDITDQGVEAAQKMAFLVEQGHSAEF